MPAPRLRLAAAGLATAALLSGCSLFVSDPTTDSSATSSAPATTTATTTEPTETPVAPDAPAPVTEHHGLAAEEELAFAQRILAELVAKQNYGYAWADPGQVQETVDVASSTAEAVGNRQAAYRDSAGTGPDTAYQLDEQFIGVPTISYDADFLPVRIAGTVERTSTQPTEADAADADATGDAAATSANATDYQVYAVSLVWTQIVTADGAATWAWVYDAVTS